MNTIDVLAALLSALLHAGWNAAVKADRHPAQAMTAQMLLGAVLVAPALLWSGLPAPAAWPWRPPWLARAALVAPGAACHPQR